MPTKLTSAQQWAHDLSAGLDSIIALRRQAAAARQERILTPTAANAIDDKIEALRAELGDSVGLAVTAPISHVARAACDCGDRHYPHCKRAPGDMAL